MTTEPEPAAQPNPSVGEVLLCPFCGATMLRISGDAERVGHPYDPCVLSGQQFRRAAWNTRTTPATGGMLSGEVERAFAEAFDLIFETYNRPADTFYNYETWANWQYGKIVKALTPMQKVRAALAGKGEA